MSQACALAKMFNSGVRDALLLDIDDFWKALDEIETYARPS